MGAPRHRRSRSLISWIIETHSDTDTNQIMSCYGYKSLNQARNEIRILRFSEPTKSNKDVVRGTLHHACSEELLPGYEQYLREVKPPTPTTIVRAWLKG